MMKAALTHVIFFLPTASSNVKALCFSFLFYLASRLFRFGPLMLHVIGVIGASVSQAVHLQDRCDQEVG